MTLRFQLGLLAVAWTLVTALIPPGRAAGQAANPQSTTGLKDGWKKDLEVPEVRVGADGKPMLSLLKLWVEQGWLVARYERPDRGLEWQVVLAQAIDPRQPEIRLDDKPAGFELKYRSCFIRDHNGYLSVLREPKTKDMLAWPFVPIDAEAKQITFTSFGMQVGDQREAHEVSIRELADWRWLACGLAGEKTSSRGYDIWMRIQHKHQLPGIHLQRGLLQEGIEGNRFAWDVYHREYLMHEEGDLFFARRSTETNEEMRAKLANVLNLKPTPELTVTQWFNAPEEKSLKQLQGKVAVLYFWNGDNYQAFAARLQRKYRDQGLVVIGVHPSKESEKLELLIKERQIDLPIAIDTPRTETERAFSVKIWPTYFLIDKTGKIRQGYLEHPPTDQQVEELLK